jgi:hypothetical protein
MNLVRPGLAALRAWIYISARRLRLHDAGRADGFVSGDEDEAFDAVREGEVGKAGGAEGVVLDGFTRLVLHHGDVFMGGGVIDDGRAVFGKDLGDAREVDDVGDDGFDAIAMACANEFLLDLEEVWFGAVEEEQSLW